MTLSISPFELTYETLVLTPSLSPTPSLPDYLLASLLYHLHSLLWKFIDYTLPRLCTNPCPSPINIRNQTNFSLLQTNLTPFP